MKAPASAPMNRDFLGWRVWNATARGPQVAKNAVGTAMERLVARTIGARLWDQRLPAFPIPREVATEVDGTPYGLLPDAWWAKQSALVEVKCGIARFYTTERQWRAYRWARDTQLSGLPVVRPRVFYAFVGYRLDRRSDKYAGAHAIVDDAIAQLRYILVVDSRLVEAFIGESPAVQEDHVGPLSPLLGAWNAHWNIRAHRLQAWADNPRAQLDAHGLTRWRVSSVRKTLRAASAELAASGWATIPDVPALVIAPCRRARPGQDDIPGTQSALFGDVACPDCGFWGQPGACPECGGFTAF